MINQYLSNLAIVEQPRAPCGFSEAAQHPFFSFSQGPRWGSEREP